MQPPALSLWKVQWGSFSPTLPRDMTFVVLVTWRA